MTDDRRRRGLLVAIEGIDGAGKSTVHRLLLEALRGEGYSVGVWREPHDAALGDRAQRAGPDRPWTAAMFFTLDRALARRRLEEELEVAEVVLSDRSFFSTLAYQGSALARPDREALARIQRSATVVPDVILWLRLPAQEALARVRSRGSGRAPLERRKILERVAAAYARLARGPGWVSLDARAAPEVTVATAVGVLRRRLGRRSRRPRA